MKKNPPSLSLFPSVCMHVLFNDIGEKIAPRPWLEDAAEAPGKKKKWSVCNNMGDHGTLSSYHL